MLTLEGKMKITGKLWWSIADDAPIYPGEEITVVKQKGLTLTVTRCENGDTKRMNP
jgi:membrane protein implicated in regulation of membrane protease activity